MDFTSSGELIKVEMVVLGLRIKALTGKWKEFIAFSYLLGDK